MKRFKKISLIALSLVLMGVVASQVITPQEQPTSITTVVNDEPKGG